MEKRLYERPTMEVVKIECSVIASSTNSDFDINLPDSSKENPDGID